MTSKRLGALLKATPSAVVVDAAQPLPEAQAEPETKPHKEATVVVSEPEVPLQVMVPASVRRQVTLLAAHDGQTVRAVVLKGLRAVGIAIADAEVEDRRTRRGK